MDRSKHTAIEFFCSLGFDAHAIPESTEKRADVRAHDGDFEYIVEVKDKLDDPETIAAQTETFSVGDDDLTVRTSPLDRSNRLDAIFKGAAKQIHETPSRDHTYNLLWLCCDGIDAKLCGTRARNTFYGVVPVVPADSDDPGCMCLYFDFNTSYVLTSINGLIVVADRGLVLYLNEFASSAHQFRQSKLVRALGDSVFDPVDQIDTGYAIAFRGNISRRNENDILDAMEQQLGRRYRTARMNRYLY